MHYEVLLKENPIPMPLDADKFTCEEGYVVFYTQPAKGEKFEEFARFKSSNVKNIKEE